MSPSLLRSLFGDGSDDVSQAKRMAAYYRERFGWNPLPSHRRRKQPIGCWAEYMDTPVEDQVFDHWPDTPNLQLLCGVRWGLAVIDLDGDAAVGAWKALTLYRPKRPTWTIRTGGGGWHLYYRLPPGLAELPSRLIWDGGVKHHRIDLLGDRSLAIAPPSRHVTTGRRYEFGIGPDLLPEPAELPGWVIDLRDARAAADPPMPAVPHAPWPAPGGHHDRRAVLAAIGDKLGLVRSWGLRVLGRQPGRNGWVKCRALNRVDRCPSAGFHPVSGYYSEPPGFRLSLFDIGVRLGVFPDWVTAVNGLGERYEVKA